MESRDHARLGPSAAHRWISCPASVRVSETLEILGADTGSQWAAEGTAAHAIAEIVASYRFGLFTDIQYQAALAAWRGTYADAGWLGDRTIEDAQDDMVLDAMLYAGVIADERARQNVAVEMHLELKVHPGIDGVWGTGDCVLIGPHEVAIIDYKYGTGVKVDAPDNEQLMLYALGAVEADLIGTAEVVRIIIVQPRLDHVSVWETTVEHLVKWRDTVAVPAAALAVTDDAPFGPGEEACRFCPARGQCKAQTAWIAQRDFGTDETRDADLDLMDGDDYAAALEILPAVRAWVSAVEEKALERVYSRGERIPGWKVVISGGTRKITDTEKAIETLIAAGYDRTDVVKPPVDQLQTLARLDKMCGKGKQGAQRLAFILGDLMGQTEGRPSLVTEDDGRPEVTANSTAADDFAEED